MILDEHLIPPPEEYTAAESRAYDEGVEDAFEARYLELTFFKFLALVLLSLMLWREIYLNLYGYNS